MVHNQTEDKKTLKKMKQNLLLRLFSYKLIHLSIDLEFYNGLEILKTFLFSLLFIFISLIFVDG